jgi:thioredoxin 1
MNAVKHISPQTFRQEVVLQSSMPVLVDFYADWCGPCRMLAPILERIAREFAGRVKVVKVNVDEAPELADQYRVESIPTLIFVLNGRVVRRAAGFASESGLRQALHQWVNASTAA